MRKAILIPKSIIAATGWLHHYLLVCGFFCNLLLVSGYFYDRLFFFQVYEKLIQEFKLTINPNALIDERRHRQKQFIQAIEANFGSWQPWAVTDPIAPNTIQINDKTYLSLASASAALKDHDTMVIGEGVYHEALIVNRHHVHIMGRGRVVFDGVAAEGKAALVIKGEAVTLSNIECRNITVADENGACVRLENTDLTMNHVYFHDSEQGLLSNGDVQIWLNDSRFERLGKNGYAHGVYLGGGEVTIDKCLFLAIVSQGHEIKSRARKTVIKNSVVASFEADDSRLLDIPNGGELWIENSILEKGPYSTNATAIGYGLEGMLYKNNSITLKRNTLILERENFNQWLHVRSEELFSLEAIGNVVVSKDPVDMPGINWLFANRKEAKMADYPKLPILDNH